MLETLILAAALSYQPQLLSQYATSTVTVNGPGIVAHFDGAARPYYPTTDFLTLFDNPDNRYCNTNTHVYFRLPAARQAEIRAKIHDEQYNSIHVYTLNEGDYCHPVSPYAVDAFKFPGTLRQDVISAWRQDLQVLFDEGIRPFLWLFSDDAPTIRRARNEDLKRYITQMVNSFSDMPVMWVLALEADETFSLEGVRSLRDHLRRELTRVGAKGLMGIHLRSTQSEDRNSRFKHGFDFEVVQISRRNARGQPRSDAEMRSIVRNIVDCAQPKLIGEYNQSHVPHNGSEQAESKRLGTLLAQAIDCEFAGIGQGINFYGSD